MFETLGVLVVFLILLGFGMIFYNTVQQGNLQEELEKQAELKSLSISEKALLLPDLDCTIKGVVEVNCVDMLKVFGFVKVTNQSLDARAEYFNVFETSTVELKQLWPAANWTITLYNWTPTTFKSRNVFTSPILLHYPLSQTNTFGIMEVTTYVEE